jgi:hypothetical protein
MLITTIAVPNNMAGAHKSEISLTVERKYAVAKAMPATAKNPITDNTVRPKLKSK